jgi:hypothetical protein
MELQRLLCLQAGLLPYGSGSMSADGDLPKGVVPEDLPTDHHLHANGIGSPSLQGSLHLLPIGPLLRNSPCSVHDLHDGSADLQADDSLHDLHDGPTVLHSQSSVHHLHDG